MSSACAAHIKGVAPQLRRHDRGLEVAPVKPTKNAQKEKQSFKFAGINKKSEKQAKNLAIGAAVGAIGHALLASNEKNRD